MPTRAPRPTGRSRRDAGWEQGQTQEYQRLQADGVSDRELQEHWSRYGDMGTFEEKSRAADVTWMKQEKVLNPPAPRPKITFEEDPTTGKRMQRTVDPVTSVSKIENTEFELPGYPGSRATEFEPKLGAFTGEGPEGEWKMNRTRTGEATGYEVTKKPEPVKIPKFDQPEKQAKPPKGGDKDGIVNWDYEPNSEGGYDAGIPYPSEMSNRNWNEIKTTVEKLDEKITDFTDRPLDDKKAQRIKMEGLNEKRKKAQEVKERIEKKVLMLGGQAAFRALTNPDVEKNFPENEPPAVAPRPSAMPSTSSREGMRRIRNPAGKTFWIAEDDYDDAISKGGQSVE